MKQFNEGYYRNNNKYSNYLENQDLNSFAKYIDFIKNYLKKDGLFLDVGCGTGLILELLKRSKIKAVGIDISETSIKKCKKKRLDCVYYNGAKIPFENQNFDIVGSFNVLEHTDDPIAFLNEQSRVLKKKGYLIIVCPNFLSITNSYHWHTSGFINKTKNLFQIIEKILSSDQNFDKMQTIVRKDFHADDDACNVTNPITIIKWAKRKRLTLVHWSSQEQYADGIKKILDKAFLKFFLGASFMVFQK